MKAYFITLQLIVLITTSIISQATPAKEFSKINKQRNARMQTINLIKAEKLASEGPEGTLEISSKCSPNTAKIVYAENEDRKNQFLIISKANGSSYDSVAAKFAAKMGADKAHRNTTKLLTIHGSNTVGATLAPKLVTAYLKTLGHKDINTLRTATSSRITFNMDGKKSRGLIEIKAHGSSTAFRESNYTRKVGLAGNYCDIGMTSRPIKEKELKLLQKKGLGKLNTPSCEHPIALDGVAVIINRSNPIKALTVKQIASIFSGETKNWKQLGGSDLPISLFSRDTQSGTWDTFKSKVMQPLSSNLATRNISRLEDSAELVRNVGSKPGAIGFCGLSHIDSTVKGIAISDIKDLTAFQPTRLTIKTQNYPLSRLLYFYLPSNAKPFARDFIKFTMSNEGQQIVDKAGLVGQGHSNEEDLSNAEEEKLNNLNNPDIPEEYKKLIKNYNRDHSQSNILFDPKSMEPDTNSSNNLDRLASFLAENGNENKKVLLIGFSDNLGNESSNITLSLRRVDQIATILKSKGINNIRAEGLGQIMPVADNKTYTGRIKNRRVEIWLSNNQPKKQTTTITIKPKTTNASTN